jgi:hypothetical protein
VLVEVDAAEHRLKSEYPIVGVGVRQQHGAELLFLQHSRLEPGRERLHFRGQRFHLVNQTLLTFEQLRAGAGALGERARPQQRCRPYQTVRAIGAMS